MSSPFRLNTQQLAMYMLKDPYIREQFGGVLALDQLQFTTFKPKIYIVNTDPHNEPGQHWFCLYISDTPEHFDPVGNAPLFSVNNFLILNGPNYLYNSKRVQSYVSETCGLFCLFYCYFRCRSFSFKEIMSMFSNNLKLNEAIVIYFYENTK